MNEIKNLIEILSNPRRWVETFLRNPADKDLPLVLRSYQREVLEKSRTNRRIILRFGRRCLPSYSPILLYDGKIKKLSDIEVGDTIVSRDDDAQPIQQKVINKFSNGIKPVYRIKLNDGREIDCTSNHPLLCWVQVKKHKKWYHYKYLSIDNGLKKGMKVTCLKSWPYFGNVSAKDEAKLLGYLITDGHLVEDQTPKFTAKNRLYIDEVRNLTKTLFDYDCVIKKRQESNCYDIHLTDSNKCTTNKVKDYFRPFDILGTKAKYDGIIARISQYDKESLALFLNRVWAGDGCVSLSIRKDRIKNGKNVDVSLTSHYLDFLIKIRSILYKIGVRAKIKKEVRKSPHSDKLCTNYRLYFSDVDSVESFLSFVGPIYGKEQQCLEGLKELKKRSRRQYRKGSVFYYKSVIKSIEYINDLETYDITVEKYHNFTVNGMVVHNSGKSVTMCADTLWWASTYPTIRKIETNVNKQKPMRIMVACPYESHIKELWTTYEQLIGNSDVLKQQITKIRSSDDHLIEFDNGSVINGYTIGISSSNRGISLRGISADLVYMDEMDYIPRDIIEAVILPIWTNHHNTIIRVSSTPSGDRAGMFFEWCSKAKDLGWYHLHIPSWHPDNAGWMSEEQAKAQNIPVTESTEFQVKSVTQSDVYQREYGGEFGEEFGGVYKQIFIDKTLVQYGRNIDLTNPEIFDPGWESNPANLYVMGVDWNTFANGGQVVVVEYCLVPTIVNYFNDESKKDITIDFTQKFRIFYRKGIKSQDATQRLTRQEIIRLLSNSKIDHIYVDYGAGDTNVEELTLYGKQHPELDMDKKLHVIDQGMVVDHWDPILREKVSKRNKSMMVNFSVLCIEEGNILLPKEEDYKTRLVGQMRGYEVKNMTSRGEFSYKGEDHILDAFNLAIYGFQIQYGELLRKRIPFSPFSLRDPRLQDYPHRNEEPSYKMVKNRFNIRDPEEEEILKPPKPIHMTMPKIGIRSGVFVPKKRF